MLKGIIIIFAVYILIGLSLAYGNTYTSISKQIDVKTMSLKQPSYIISSFSKCVGSCRNYSSSSSSWGSGGGGK